jgi:hypothetical protein
MANYYNFWPFDFWSNDLKIDTFNILAFSFGIEEFAVAGFKQTTSLSCNENAITSYQIQWAPLNRITLGPRQTDSINRMIPLTNTHTLLFWGQTGLGFLRKIEPINWMILLTVIPLCELHCILMSKIDKQLFRIASLRIRIWICKRRFLNF